MNGPAALKTLVMLGALLQVLVKGAKFSLFKPAEEMVYIGLDDESRSKGGEGGGVGPPGNTPGAALQLHTPVISFDMGSSMPQASLQQHDVRAPSGGTSQSWVVAATTRRVPSHPTQARRPSMWWARSQGSLRAACFNNHCCSSGEGAGVIDYGQSCGTSTLGGGCSVCTGCPLCRLMRVDRRCPPHPRLHRPWECPHKHDSILHSPMPALQIDSGGQLPKTLPVMALFFATMLRQWIGAVTLLAKYVGCDEVAQAKAEQPPRTDTGDSAPAPSVRDLGAA